MTNGKPEKCRISVGFKYAKETVQKQLRHMLLVDKKFAIPPGAPAHPVSASKVLDRDAAVIGLFVHMHLRGRDMTFKAHQPDGTSETLLLVPNYSFDWQMPYVYERGKVRFPKGTRLEAIAHYDNSAFNPYNPDPSATVKDGPQTYHEMLNGFELEKSNTRNAAPIVLFDKIRSGRFEYRALDKGFELKSDFVFKGNRLSLSVGRPANRR